MNVHEIHGFFVSPNQLFAECASSALKQADVGLNLQWVEQLPQLSGNPEAMECDVVLFDVASSQTASTSDIGGIWEECPAACVIVLGDGRDQQAVEYLMAGASDYRDVNQESIDRLCKAIRSALDGMVDHSPERARALCRRLRELAQTSHNLPSGAPSTGAVSPISTRELEILRFVEEGMSNKQIAAAMHISLHTVKNHVHRILEKLSVDSRLEAVRLANANGWFSAGIGGPRRRVSRPGVNNSALTPHPIAPN